MADSKITALTALTVADPTVDMFPVVDVSDTTMAASGTTKRISINNILACSPSATLASATITGDLTVRTNKLFVNATGVGVGTTNVLGDFTIQNGSNCRFEVTSSAGGTVIENLNNARNAYLNMTMYADAYIWNRLGSEVMRLNATGLGVGGSPSYKLDVLGTGNSGILGVTTTGQVSSLRLRQTQNLGANTRNWEIRTNGVAYGNLEFAVGASQQSDTYTAAMVLDSSGNLFVGKTATGLGTVGIQASPSGWFQATVSGDSSLFTNRLASDGKTIQLYRQTLEVGNISVTTTGATFNSTSDYRLKEAVAPLSGGLARVNALKPSVYKWKSNGLSGEGFLAHELAEVVPFAVTGEKDAVNEDGSINAQSIDMSRVVPIIVAAIQELAAEVNALKKA